MVDRPYSGTTVRAGHYSVRPSVLGVSPEHLHPDPEPDPFTPQVDTPPNQAGTIYVNEGPDAGPSNMPMVGQPITHWYNGQPPVASGVPYGQAQQAMQERMMVDHSDTNYVPDSIRLYQHATEGQANEFIIGRMPQNSGVDPGTDLEYLVAGTNSYDYTNQPNPDVYGGDAANVGRYRLGVKTNLWGLYQNPLGKFGQDAQLRAYTGLHPALPVDKPPMTDTAPYTPNSTGTTHWLPAAFSQVPSMFALPSETATTDYEVANTFQDSGSEFSGDRGRL